MCTMGFARIRIPARARYKSKYITPRVRLADSVKVNGNGEKRKEKLYEILPAPDVSLVSILFNNLKTEIIDYEYFYRISPRSYRSNPYLTQNYTCIQLQMIHGYPYRHGVQFKSKRI